MIVAGLVLTGIGALIHVYIFVLESLLWTTERARATFGTDRAEAEQTRALAFNQGFYNLFSPSPCCSGPWCSPPVPAASA